MPTRRIGFRRGERGQATLEMVGVLPLAMIVLGAVIQLFMVGYAAVAAESTARMAAREYSQGNSPTDAEHDALQHAPGVFDPTVNVYDGNVSRGGAEPSVDADALSGAVSAKSTYEVPFLGFGVKGLNMHVTRYSVVPRTE